MDDTRYVTQYGQDDVDEKIGIAPALEEDAEGREYDGKNDLADVATVKAKLDMVEYSLELDGNIDRKRGKGCGSRMTFGAVADERARD